MQLDDMYQQAANAQTSHGNHYQVFSQLMTRCSHVPIPLTICCRLRATPVCYETNVTHYTNAQSQHAMWQIQNIPPFSITEWMSTINVSVQ